jgi:hypothetical protein
MQLAPAGSIAEPHYGGAPVSMLLATYLLLILVAMIVIAILEDNDGPFA